MLLILCPIHLYAIAPQILILICLLSKIIISFFELASPRLPPIPYAVLTSIPCSSPVQTGL